MEAWAENLRKFADWSLFTEGHAEKYSEQELRQMFKGQPLSKKDVAEKLRRAADTEFEDEEIILTKQPVVISKVQQCVSRAGNDMLVLTFQDTLCNVKAVKYQTLYNVRKLLKVFGVDEVPDKVDDIIDIMLGVSVQIDVLSRFGNQHIVDYFHVIQDNIEDTAVDMEEDIPY